MRFTESGSHYWAAHPVHTEQGATIYVCKCKSEIAAPWFKQAVDSITAPVIFVAFHEDDQHVAIAISQAKMAMKLFGQGGLIGLTAGENSEFAGWTGDITSLKSPADRKYSWGSEVTGIRNRLIKAISLKVSLY